MRGECSHFLPRRAVFVQGPESLTAFVLWFGGVWAARPAPLLACDVPTGTGEMHVLGSAPSLSVAQRAEAAIVGKILPRGDQEQSVPESRGHNPAVPGAEFSLQCAVFDLIFSFHLIRYLKIVISHLHLQLLLKSWKMLQPWTSFQLMATMARAVEG